MKPETASSSQSYTPDPRSTRDWGASSLCAPGPRWDQLAAEYGRRVQDLSVGFCNPDRSRVRHVDLLHTRQKTPNPTLMTNLGGGEAPGGAATLGGD